MAKRNRGGRTRKTSGRRKPCGRLCHESRPEVRQEEQPLSAVMYQRIKEHGQKVGVDPRLLTELGRLNWDRKLTNSQAVAGLRIGGIYRRYERLNRLRRIPKSPSYEPGFGDPDIAEDRLDPEALSDLEAQFKEARDAWLDLEKKIPDRLRSAVQDLCVEDRNINPVALEAVRTVLDQLATYWGIAGRHTNPPNRPRGQTAAVPQKQRVSAGNGDWDAWNKVVGALRPDLAVDSLRKAFRVSVALREREKFRAGKAKIQSNQRLTRSNVDR